MPGDMVSISGGAIEAPPLFFGRGGASPCPGGGR